MIMRTNDLINKEATTMTIKKYFGQAINTEIRQYVFFQQYNTKYSIHVKIE